jgi:hypothetical protein
LVNSYLKLIAIGRARRRLRKDLLVPTERAAPVSDSGIRKISTEIVSEAISDLRDEPEVCFDYLTDQAKAVARRHLCTKRSEWTLGLKKFGHLLFVIDQEIH